MMPTPLPAGHDRLRDHAREKAEQYPPDDSHLRSGATVVARNDGRVLTAATVARSAEPAPTRPEDERERDPDDPDDKQDDAYDLDVDARSLGGDRPGEDGADRDEQETQD